MPPESPGQDSGLAPALSGASGERPSADLQRARRELFHKARSEGRRECLALGFCSILTAASAVGFAGGTAMLLSSVIGFAPPSGGPVPWIFLTLASLLLRAISNSSRGRIGGRLGAKLRTRWQETWIDAPPGPAGDALRNNLSSLIEGTSRIESWYARFLPAGIHLAVVPPLLLLTVFLLDPLSGLVLLIGGPLIPIFMVLIGLIAQDRIRTQWQLLQRLQQRFRDILHGFEDLQLLGRDDPRSSGVIGLSAQFRRTTMKVLLIAFLSGFVLEFFAMIGTALVAVQAGIRLVEGHLLFPTAWMVLILTPEYFLPFRQLGLNHHAGMEGNEAAADLMAPGGKPDKAPPPAEKVDPDGEASGLVCRNLRFAYPGGKELFDGLSFQLPAGSRLAITGPSGCGKSTLVRILLGLLPPDQGLLAWNRRWVHSTSAAHWKSFFAWVPQHPSFFSGTVLHNLRLAHPQTSRESCHTALASVGLRDWIESLPHGLDTGIGEAARNLSEGQRQRLAIARSLLGRAPILVLDEPSAALDPESEEKLVSTLDHLAGEKTLVVITHRQRTARGASHWLHCSDGWQFSEGGGR